MATKFQLINQIYEEETKLLCDPVNWQKFLNSACKNYKCRFDEQLLIYAQKPDATAVLEIEKWNNNFGRWVNKGANGIAVFDSQNIESKRLKYYFDITDTHETSRSISVPIWEYKNSYEQSLIDSLENSFGELEFRDNLAMAIFSSAKNLSEDNISDYITDTNIENSLFQDSSADYLKVAFREVVTNSIAYMMLTRCGFDPKEHFEDDDFRFITNFDTPQTINALGIATSDIAEMGLREIETTVISLQKNERNSVRTFAKDNEKIYNVDTEKRTSIEKENDYGNDLQSSGRLQHSELDFTTRNADSVGQIRTSTQGIFGEKQTSDLSKSVDILQAQPIFVTDRETSTGDDVEFNHTIFLKYTYIILSCCYEY